jgi:hypothetical protein
LDFWFENIPSGNPGFQGCASAAASVDSVVSRVVGDDEVPPDSAVRLLRRAAKVSILKLSFKGYLQLRPICANNEFFVARQD